MYFKAKNNSGSRYGFEMRKLFKEEAHTKNGLADPLDLWIDKRNFGDINHYAESINVSESFLKVFPDDQKNVLALNFVVDAAADMRYYYRQAKGHGKIKYSGLLLDLTPTSGYEGGSTSAYHNYMQGLYNAFEGSLQSKNKNKILNFKTFLNELFIFLRSTASHSPVTKTSYIVSKLNNPLNSGLILEYHDLNHGDDLIKSKMFLGDDNYLFYRYATEKYGFLIDKNAPWRIIADIKSDPMRRYMSKYGITYKNIFDSYYYKAHETDVDALKAYLYAFYQAHITTNPTFRKKDLCTTTTRNKLPISILSFNKNYGDYFWIKVYSNLRFRESKSDLSKLKNVISNSYDIKNIYGMSKVYEYINTQARVNVISNIR